ncbi:MAG: cohesin domain-containing protein [Gammaproteobacteria bacterium]|nr:cohesin domain-containing protein [Gammaproteobacteria bacterium]
MLAAALAAGCATDRLHKEGLQAIEAGQYEEGLQKLEKAVAADPANLTYRLDLQGRREQAIQVLLGEGDRARAAGRLDDAQATYQRALVIDAGNARAQAGLAAIKTDKRHAEVVAAAKRDIDQGNLDQAETRLREVLAENPGSAAANSLRAQIDAARGPRSVTPHLKSSENRLVTLQFRDAATKMVFEVLARQTGINFIFDKDVKSDGKTTIFVQNVPVEQAIGLILGQNALGQQVLSQNMVLIYPNTPAKQKEYQSQIVRTFYLSNSDPKRIMEMLKTMLDAKTLFVDDRAGAVVMRDTPEAVRMAERLIASIDVPEAEVMLEVEVLELTRTRLEQLGINYPSQVTMRPTPLAGDPLVLADLKDQDETTIQISPISVTVDLRKEVSTSNLLASPRIRARNHEKAKILIGQRVPVITSSTIVLNGGNGTNTNVQYVDVGLTLEVQPDIYLDGDVAIKVNLEVSNIIRAIESEGGTLAYQIGTRNASTLLRLKDGETQVLAGLIQDTDRRTSNRIPGLGDIPIVGRLFGTRNDDAEKSEIVLSITPRIIRAQSRPSSDNIEFYYGTDANQRAVPLGAGSVAGAASVRVASSTSPATVAPQAGAYDGNTDDPTNEGADTTQPEPVTRPTLRLDGPGQIAVGQDFEVTLQLDNAQSIAAIKSVLRFDPSVLQFTSGAAGSLVPGDQQQAGEPRADTGPGRVRFEIGGTSVSGNGALFTARFKALQPRPQTMVTIQQFTATDASGELIGAMAPRPLVVVVTP